MPLCVLDALEGSEGTVDNGENNEEDTCACVLAYCLRSPGFREEVINCGSVEGHFHHAASGGGLSGGVVHAHVHVHAVIQIRDVRQLTACSISVELLVCFSMGRMQCNGA